MIENEKGVRKTVTMFGDIIDLLMTEVEDEFDIDVETKLLSLTTKRFKIKPNNVVTSVENIEE